MAEQRTIAFSKMSGLGNDFIIIDARENALALAPEQVRQLATRDNDITKGCDQLLVLDTPESGGDIFMQIFNANGDEAEACGNGARAVAAWLAKNGIKEPDIETKGGILHAQAASSGARVTMPSPKFDWRDIPLSGAIEDTAQVQLHEDLPLAFLVNVGNPHAVFFVGDGQDIDALAQKYGAELEYGKVLGQDSNLEQGANISFASIHRAYANSITTSIATWERGTGLTQACGTGACATIVAARRRNLIPLIEKPNTISVWPPSARKHLGNPPNSIKAFWLRFIRLFWLSDSIEVFYDEDNGELQQSGTVKFEFDGEITL